MPRRRGRRWPRAPRSKIVAEAKDIAEYLGPQKYMSEVAERTAEPGVATGLAWTPVGGDILFIEATRMPGKGSLVLTGQLGDVMKESAQAALSFVRSEGRSGSASRRTSSKRPTSTCTSRPAPSPRMVRRRASPCSRRSTSLLTGKPVRGDVAMTGEITLRGNVLPVGGIKEKILAAHRAGIKRIIMPERNQQGPHRRAGAGARRRWRFVYVKKMDELLPLALTELPEKFGKPSTPTPVLVTPPTTTRPPSHHRIIRTNARAANTAGEIPAVFFLPSRT